MKKDILFVILEQYSEWEAAYLAPLLKMLGEGKYDIKTVSLTKESVKSIGGFTVVPDYEIKSVPTEYEGVILVGGMSWRTEEALQVRPLVEEAIKKQKVVAAICDGTVFLGAMSILNNVYHTSNDLNDLKQWAGRAYTGETKYVLKQVVRDGLFITANGTATLEFAKEILLALKVTSEDKITAWCDFYKLGCYKAPMSSL